MKRKLTWEKVDKALSPCFDRKEYIRQADQLWRRIIAYEFSSRCIICKRMGTDSHHWMFGRSVLKHRWTINNGVYVCRECHQKAERFPRVYRKQILMLNKARREWYESLPALQVEPMLTQMIQEERQTLRDYSQEHNILTEDIDE